MATNLRVEKWQDLHQRLRGIAKRRAALDAEEARCLREADRLQLWRRFGYIHMLEYLERELGYGPHVSNERLRVARELGGLPQIEANLADGTLSHSAVRELSRVATHDTELEWLDAARGKNLRQIEALVSGHKRGDRPSDPTTPDLANHVIRLELSPEVFALLRQTRNALADELGSRLDDSALIETLCRRALEGSGSSDRPAHQIAITVCESCERAWQSGAGREIEIAPEVADRARCDAELIGSLNDEQPARVTATVTQRTRRQVLARDHHRCTVPGCRSARNLDLHHIDHQRDGGGHALSNLSVVCSGHHQQLHEGALKISGQAPHALVFTWRDAPQAECAPSGAVDQGARTDQTAAGGSPPEAYSGAAENVSQGEDEALVRGDLPVCSIPEGQAHEARIGDGADTLARDAQIALVTAGYEPSEARAAVERARSHVGEPMSLEHLIREALRCLATAATG